MRKVIQTVLVSADGVVGDPRLWALDYRDADVEKDSVERLGDSDTMILGRGTYELFAATWPGQSSDFAGRMNSMRKYVFSSTLAKANWGNSTIVTGDARPGWPGSSSRTARTSSCTAMARWRTGSGSTG